MSDLEKAARDAVEAADNTELTRQIAAILAAQQLLNAQQPQAPAPVRQEFDAKKWVVIGGVVVSAGLVASLFAIAIAIGAVCATTCLLVLRSVWGQAQKNR
ncbi:hypothetical protein [Streptomyces marokkonensis]|uniref:hypothetical protein n=1 Tax=Streptomyces marokkonensis TaxID=324855 RepID=UPI0011F3B892|nr:hypothetical protein [Streptomyces marokkonensis]